MGDQELVRQYAAQGDAEAFAELVRRYGTMVAATCRRACYDLQDADDAAQEVFLRLAQGAGEIRSNVAAWLHRSAINAARDLNRKRRRRQRREAAVAIETASTGDDRQAQLAELHECVDAALGRLDAAEHEIIVQRFFAGRSQVELAQVAGVSEATMSRRVADAVATLRQQLQQMGAGLGAIGATDLLESWLEGQEPAPISAELTTRLVKIGLSGTGAAPAGVGLGLRLKAIVAAGMLLAGGMGAVLWMAEPESATAGPAAIVTPAPAATGPSTAASSEQAARARQLIYDLRTSPLLSEAGVWVKSVKELVAIGPDAVPEIIAELDRAPSDSQMRAMALVLRAIGDTRAIPALIRAMPRTNLQTSDMGLSVLDRELWQFMSEHDVPPGRDPYPRFGYARAVRQVNAALETITGRDAGEKAFFDDRTPGVVAAQWQA